MLKIKRTQVLNATRAKSAKSMHCRKKNREKTDGCLLSREHSVQTNSAGQPKGHKDPEEGKKKVLASLGDGLTFGLAPFHLKLMS